MIPQHVTPSSRNYLVHSLGLQLGSVATDTCEGEERPLQVKGITKQPGNAISPASVILFV